MILNPCDIPLPPSPALTTASFLDHHYPSSISKALTMSNNNETSETGSSIKVLELHNYHQWSDLMLSYFLEHNLDGIIDGTEEIPDISTPAERNNWMLRQKKAAGFIARKLDSSNRDLFINDDTRRNPQALWNAIQLEYASKKARNRSRLFSRFLSLNCNDGNLS